MMRPRLVINATNVEMGLGIDRNNPEDRVHLVKILDLIAHATEEAVDRGLEREDVLLWLDTDIGEGALFRAIAKNLHTMLSFDFDSRDEFEVAANDLTDDVDRFKPAALVMPVNNAAAEMGVPNSRSNIRPSELFVSPSPIERHIAIYEYANSFDIPIGWDVRKPRGEWSDALLRSENALRTITIFQDNGLDPSLWILKIPNVKLVTQTIAARTHIDDRNDVLTCFSLEPIFENVLPNQGHAFTHCNRASNKRLKWRRRCQATRGSSSARNRTPTH